eukprot:IDg3417t1
MQHKSLYIPQAIRPKDQVNTLVVKNCKKRVRIFHPRFVDFHHFLGRRFSSVPCAKAGSGRAMRTLYENSVQHVGLHAGSAPARGGLHLSVASVHSSGSQRSDLGVSGSMARVPIRVSWLVLWGFVWRPHCTGNAALSRVPAVGTSGTSRINKCVESAPVRGADRR